ncbi:MAG: DUF1127 domain-containing protein [Pseudomonadota bacterium]
MIADAPSLPRPLWGMLQLFRAQSQARARVRQDYLKLLELDDWMLRDMGIDRGEVHARLHATRRSPFYLL